jgi:hypothetical protein
MWYHRKTDKVRAFRLPTQPDECINNDLVLMLNEREIGEKWVSMGDETIKVNTPTGAKFATWGDWIINQRNDLFVMSDAAFQDNFDIAISFDPAKFYTDESVYWTRNLFVNE